MKFEVSSELQNYHNSWPSKSLTDIESWHRSPEGDYFIREMPEKADDIAVDSRWPAFFPSPICLVTTGDEQRNGLEKVVGASIVNRFPYIMALSFCRQSLSIRHYDRRRFTDILEQGGTLAVQFLPPGKQLDKALGVIQNFGDEKTEQRIQLSTLPTRRAHSNSAPVFKDAYMVYEGKLTKPSRDLEKNPIFQKPYLDIGSHRIYFLEIEAIQLREDIAIGKKQILWRSLPNWRQHSDPSGFMSAPVSTIQKPKYEKGYNPLYAFPSTNTIGFEGDEIKNGMVVKSLPALAENQIEIDNDKARWPCFFPQSAGMITMWTENGKPNLMPCGSTTVVSRSPFVIAPCISYGRINERYAPRASLKLIEKSGTFGVGVPFLDERVTKAMRYAGSVSYNEDQNKVENAQLSVQRGGK